MEEYEQKREPNVDGFEKYGICVNGLKLCLKTYILLFQYQENYKTIDLRSIPTTLNNIIVASLSQNESNAK